MKSLKKAVLTTVLVSNLLAGVSVPVFAQSVAEETLARNEEKAKDPKLTPEVFSENDGIEKDDQGKVISVTIGGEKAKVLEENPANTEAPVNNKPNRITTNLSEDPTTSMYFQWHTTDEDKEARLYLWEEGQSIDEAVEITPEISVIEDAYYVQQTEDGHFVYAIMWDKEEDEPLTDLDDPFQPLDQADKVLGYFTDEAFSEDNLLWLDKGYEEYSVPMPYAKFNETAYKAVAEDLKPATVYHYAVGNKAGELSEEASFTTAQAEAEDFTFVHYTDTQNAFASQNQRSEADYSKSTMDSILANEEAQGASFAIHTGDVVNDDYNDTEWNLTLTALSELNQTMPHLFVTGNHDNEDFQQHIHTPNEIEDMKSGVAYSTRYNGVQFITLNTENDMESEEDESPMISEEQMTWFEEELKAAQEARDKGEINWIIVNYHRPLVSASYHSLEDEKVQLVRDELMAILDQYDVDLVLNGHDHNVTATHALKYDEKSFVKASIATEGVTKENVTTYSSPEGTINIVPDTAGTKNYDAIYKNQSFEWLKENEDIHETFAELMDYEVTEDDIKAFRELFVTEDQPFRSPFYTDSHSNAREGNIQHYAVVDVTADKITYKMYEVIGEDLDNRETNLIHTYVIEK
ncbi:metallophosphoesterase [Ignavigranum ruoffiae]|uniref:metallophosphoesterase n=1 Tax=Ignavigranum ruoffiae TaxID=89093 RepID=UPI0024AD97E1|nr:metallophosphoesterase [Ignavigranum ruoffiae]